MTELALLRIRAALQSRIAATGLPFTELEVAELREMEGVEIRARCTHDPLFDPPATLEISEDGSVPKGPWNHRQVHVTVFPCESEETGRRVMSTTVTYLVDADHANYAPLPARDREANVVRVDFNWEFDCETMEVGVVEMRDGERMHYFSVLPPNHVVAFVKLCKRASERFA